MVGGTGVNVAVGIIVAFVGTVGDGVGVACVVSTRALGCVDVSTGGGMGEGGGG